MGECLWRCALFMLGIPISEAVVEACFDAISIICNRFTRRVIGGNRVPKLSVFGKIGQAVVSMICRQKDNFVSAIFPKIAQPANLSHANSIRGEQQNLQFFFILGGGGGGGG